MNTRSEGDSHTPDDDERHITPSDLLGLPPAQRRVMRILLRSNGMSLAELSRALEALPPVERMASGALAETVAQLLHGRWLAQVEDSNPPIYRAARLISISPAHPEERALDRHRSGANRLNGFWDAVKDDEDKRPRQPAQNAARRPGSGQVSSLFSELASPNASLSDVLSDRKDQPMKPAGGGRISSLFDELSQPSKRPAHHPDPSGDDQEG